MLCRAVSCMLRRGCSNMADDVIYHFSLQLIRLLKRITAIITLYTLQTKLRSTSATSSSCALVVTEVSRLSQSCCMCLTCCTYSMRDTARTTFSCTNMHGLDSESIVTCRNVIDASHATTSVERAKGPRFGGKLSRRKGNGF